MTPNERSRRARIAALTRWSREDAHEGTRPAREAAEARWTRQVDPDGVLPLDERRRRAERAKRAHFLRLAELSARARRRAG